MPKENNQTLEQTLWKAADKLRKNMDAAEYKHITLGLIFLKYISDAFEEKWEQLRFDFANSNSEWYIKGFCKSATLDEVKKHNYVLTPGRYVGILDEDDDGIPPFEEKMAALTAKLSDQMQEAGQLDAKIKA